MWYNVMLVRRAFPRHTNDLETSNFCIGIRYPGGERMNEHNKNTILANHWIYPLQKSLYSYRHGRALKYPKLSYNILYYNVIQSKSNSSYKGIRSFTNQRTIKKYSPTNCGTKIIANTLEIHCSYNKLNIFYYWALGILVAYHYCRLKVYCIENWSLSSQL